MPIYQSSATLLKKETHSTAGQRQKYIMGFITFLFVCFGTAFAQPTIADFDYTPKGGCTPLTVDFQNFSSGANLVYYWDFGTGFADTTNEVNPTVTFNFRGTYEVMLVATNTVTGEADTAYNEVEIDESPALDFIFDNTPYCRESVIEFRNTPSAADVDSVVWDFGDGSPRLKTKADTIYHSYTANNTYTITQYSYIGFCGDTVTKDVIIQGPQVSFSMSAYEACLGDSIVFTLGDTSGVASYTWWPEGQGPSAPNVSNVDNYKHAYFISGTYEPELVALSDLGESCTVKDSTLNIYRVVASFDYFPVSEFCDGRNIYFDNESLGNDINLWDFGDATTSTLSDPVHSYATGDYTVKLTVENSIGCIDSVSDNISINDIPAISVGEDTIICAGSSAQLFASGGDVVLWSPPFDLDDSRSYTPIFSGTTTTTLIAVVTDTATECNSLSESVKVEVIEEPTLQYESILPQPDLGNDTAVCAGESIQLMASGGDLIWWSPAQGLDDSTSYNPTFSGASTTVFTAQIYDSLTHCYSIPGIKSITVSVVQPPELVIDFNPKSDTVFVGETVQIIASGDVSDYLFSWTPDLYISCTDCPEPAITPLEEDLFEYTVEVTDINKCSALEEFISVLSRDLYTIGVDEAFTPNGDNQNDMLVARGIGIEELVEFSIYNRWGIKVFSTNVWVAQEGVSEGWDGTYEGKEQSSDNYTYYIKAKMLNGTTAEKRGSVTLYR
ncbi:MAG TPA: hypothetical protein DDX98_06800 [Bacteroidales bacterium]|jgi:gliding motility-associated-like protein|nr:hypothetical protein [Bacteroidales bacterium]